MGNTKGMLPGVALGGFRGVSKSWASGRSVGAVGAVAAVGRWVGAVGRSVGRCGVRVGRVGRSVSRSVGVLSGNMTLETCTNADPDQTQAVLSRETTRSAMGAWVSCADFTESTSFDNLPRVVLGCGRLALPSLEILGV